MDLGMLVEQAGEAASPPRPWPAEAGLFAVGDPGCVAGEVDQVVWWNFSLNMASPPAKIPLSTGEENELRGLGIQLPDPGREAVRQAARWRRPLEQAKESVLLVCPQRSADGEDNFPHPAWDEIKARLEAWHMDSKLVSARPRGREMPGATRRDLLNLPRPAAEYRLIKGTVQMSERESPSSLGPLIGCPFQYVLERAAELGSGFPAALPEAGDSRMRGNLSHHLLAEVLDIKRRGEELSPEKAREKAGELFDSDAPGMLAVLFLPGNDSARAEVRRAVCEAAYSLVALLSRMGLEVKEIEKRREDQALGITVSGKLDLLVGDPDKVVDLKWSGGSYRIQDLEAGTSYQLATYSRLVRAKGKKTFPPVAYFIIRENRLLATNALKDGVVAAGVEYEKPRGTGNAGYIRDGRLVLPPTCGFCDFGCLCKPGVD
jgi:hypothetical protein